MQHEVDLLLFSTAKLVLHQSFLRRLFWQERCRRKFRGNKEGWGGGNAFKANKYVGGEMANNKKQENGRPYPSVGYNIIITVNVKPYQRHFLTLRDLLKNKQQSDSSSGDHQYQYHHPHHNNNNSSSSSSSNNNNNNRNYYNYRNFRISRR